MKRALITGASTGFGRDLCTALLERGWTVYATLRGAEKRKDLFAADAAKYGKSLVVLDLDVTLTAQREAVAKSVADAGGLDLLINNAGFGLFGPLEELSEAEWRRQMEVNFFGALLLTQKLLPQLRASKGKVMNISSILGLTAFPLSSAYCASKFALEGMSEALYHELKPHGVQVCIVEPGAFRTKFSQNMAYAELPAGSPYTGQVESYRRWRDQRMQEKGTPPDVVIREIVRLAEARCAPLRTIVGKDASMMEAIQRWLPRNWAARLMSKVYGKMLAPGPVKNGA